MEEMEEKERIDEIRRRTRSGGAGPDGGTGDVAFLLNALEEREKRIAFLEKKNALLAAQVGELTQEIENVRADFGGGMR